MDGLTGLASGVDTASIVEKLMAVERQGRDRMDWKQAALSTRQSNLGTVQTKLLALRTAAAGMRDVGTWADTQTVESSDSLIAATRTSGAGPGGYNVDVLTLARAEQRTYTYTPPSAATQVTIGGVNIDLAAGASVDDAASAINGASGSKVYAANVQGKLILSARTTGTESTFAATGSMLSGESVRAGQNATYTVDGGAVKESQSNVVKDAIPGVQLTFKGATGGPSAITVGAPGMDADKVKEKVTAFVDAYNDLIKTTRGFVDQKRIPNVESAEDATVGVLFGDTGLSSMLSRMRGMVGGTIANNPSGMDELRELGISTGSATGGTATADSKTGLLTLNENTLQKALQDPQAVRRMLGGITGTDGFAQQMEGLVKTYTGANGTLTGRIGQGDLQVKSLQDQMTREDTRLSARELRLKTQFAAMESALANAQAQQSWLSAQLANL